MIQLKWLDPSYILKRICVQRSFFLSLSLSLFLCIYIYTAYVYMCIYMYVCVCSDTHTHAHIHTLITLVMHVAPLHCMPLRYIALHSITLAIKVNITVQCSTYPAPAKELLSLTQCRALGNRLKYMDGHEHCNYARGPRGTRASFGHHI